MMEKANQALKPRVTIPEHILALSWNIATEPRLYLELAPNPYSPSSFQIFSERFPNAITNDIVRAVVLAEPEGKYDRNFRMLGTVEQKEELRKQSEVSRELNKRLDEYCNKYMAELIRIPKELAYDRLSRVVFETADLKEIEESYAQDQRRDFRLLIVSFIENTQGFNSSTEIRSTYEKPALRRPALKVVFTAVSLILFFYLANGIHDREAEQRQIQSEDNKQALAMETQEERKALPVRLKIPRINVDTTIQYVGITPQGAMGIPNNALDVGWFDLGPRPGEMGSAVIAGHLNGENGEPGVFTNLNKLKEGDKLYIEDGRGTTAIFVVREIRTYDPGYADEVFSGSDSAQLNLITCDGVWDGAKKNYSKRLVVFSDITH